MSEHTPVPWRTAGSGPATPHFALSVRTVAGGIAEGTICRIWQRAEAKANAEFIVRACNAHDDMLEALIEVIKTAENPDMPWWIDNSNGCTIGFDLAKIKAAIARAEGPKPESRLMVDIPFPECSKKCEVIEMLGAGECDSVCPHKTEGGKPAPELSEAPKVTYEAMEEGLKAILCHAGSAIECVDEPGKTYLREICEIVDHVYGEDTSEEDEA